MPKRRQRVLGLLVFGAVISGMAAAVLVFNLGAGNVLDVVSGFVRRWFFGVFCTVFAIAQGRVYFMRSREEARVARHVPASPFAIFAVVWGVLAVAGVVYGILEPGGYWEVAGWITVTLAICVQLFLLGGIEQHARSETEGGDS